MDTLALAGLTKQDLKALRQANMISFHHHKGQGSISCTKRVRDTGPFDDRERTYEFAVRSEFTGKHEDGERVTAENAACFDMEHTAQYHEEWQTISSLLRVGDELTLAWSADGCNTGYLDGAKVSPAAPDDPRWNRPGEYKPGVGLTLHGDTLRLKVKRGDKRLVFLLSVSVCPDNSARMIRPARYYR